MHKDKRKKRLARKQKRIIRNKKLWAKFIELNNPYLQAELPKILVRDYYKEENKTTLHNAFFVDIKPPFIIQ
jgi:hypothetical protein